jgi:hypothetical protein
MGYNGSTLLTWMTLGTCLAGAISNAIKDFDFPR